MAAVPGQRLTGGEPDIWTGQVVPDGSMSRQFDHYPALPGMSHRRMVQRSRTSGTGLAYTYPNPGTGHEDRNATLGVPGYRYQRRNIGPARGVTRLLPGGLSG